MMYEAEILLPILHWRNGKKFGAWFRNLLRWGWGGTDNRKHSGPCGRAGNKWATFEGEENDRNDQAF